MKTLKHKYKKAYLELSNGERLEGRLIGASIPTSGEMVFTTGMVGYAESMTDPSYLGQILVFSFALIGNYGIPAKKGGDFILSKKSVGYESDGIKTQGIIVSTDFNECFHHHGGTSLDEWMKKENIPGIAGLDTRYLVQLIRSKKSLFGRIVPEKPKIKTEIKKYLYQKNTKEGGYNNPSAQNMLPSVSTKKIKTIGKGKTKIALVDCGVKWNIIRNLVKEDCQVILLPWDSDFGKVKADGWLFSNGPGEPNNTGDLIERTKVLLKGNVPILGICLGHQILSLASGANTFRLRYGHRGHNQPVYSTTNKRAYMTSQNHSYTVEPKSLNKDWKAWFLNANDDSIEGIYHTKKYFRGVQFHPEASSGPNDTGWIITEFCNECKKRKKRKGKK